MCAAFLDIYVSGESWSSYPIFRMSNHAIGTVRQITTPRQPGINSFHVSGGEKLSTAVTSNLHSVCMLF
jgi:hypothetical protein